MRGGCAIGDVNQKENDMDILYRNDTCLYIWVKEVNIGHEG